MSYSQRVVLSQDPNNKPVLFLRLSRSALFVFKGPRATNIICSGGRRRAILIWELACYSCYLGGGFAVAELLFLWHSDVV